MNKTHIFLYILTQKRINMHFSPTDLLAFLREKASVSRRGTTRSSTRNYKNLYGKNNFLSESSLFTLIANRVQPVLK
jgi:hypothetical protein